MLTNVLMIEIRAEAFFSLCCRIFRDPDVFQDKRAEAELAAHLVERIRTDEAIHVAYLQTVISELRAFTLKTVDGKQVKGAEIIDPLWAKMVEWHGATERELARVRTRANIEAQILKERGEAGRELLARLDALDAPTAVAAE
jgi:rubrerythrin